MAGSHRDHVPFLGVANGICPLDGDSFVPSEHIPGGEGGHIIKGLVLFGNLLNYNLSDGAADEVQLLMFQLAAGRTYDRMVTFITAGGSGARTLQMGVYSQPSPAAPGTPSARIARTDLVGTSGLSGTWVTLPLTNGAGTPVDLLIPVDGFYWLALITSSSGLKIASTPEDYPAGYLPRRELTAPSSALPDPLGASTNPLASSRFCALVEKGIVLPF